MTETLAGQFVETSAADRVKPFAFIIQTGARHWRSCSGRGALCLPRMLHYTAIRLRVFRGKVDSASHYFGKDCPCLRERWSFLEPSRI